MSEQHESWMICGITALLAILICWVAAAKAETMRVSTNGGALNARLLVEEIK